MVRVQIQENDSINRPLVVFGLVDEGKLYKHVNVKDCIGKQIEGVAVDKVESDYGFEPVTYLLFNDGTCHGFVHPNYGGG